MDGPIHQRKHACPKAVLLSSLPLATVDPSDSKQEHMLHDVLNGCSNYWGLPKKTIFSRALYSIRSQCNEHNQHVRMLSERHLQNIKDLSTAIEMKSFKLRAISQDLTMKEGVGIGLNSKISSLFWVIKETSHWIIKCQYWFNPRYDDATVDNTMSCP